MDQISDELIDSIALPVFLVDERGLIEVANASAQQLTGYPFDDLIKTNILEHMSFGDGKTTPDIFRDQKEWLVFKRVYIRHKAGRSIPVLFHAERWAADGVTRYTVTVRDLTFEEKREDEHLAVFARMDHALRGANIGVFEVDRVTHKSIVSDTWKKLMEIPLEEDVDFQSEWESRVHPDDLMRTRDADEACVANPDTRTLSEYRIRNRAGTAWRWMKSDAVGVDRDKHGRARKIIGAQTDITDQKIADEALRSSETQLRSLIEEAPVGKAMVNMDGEYVQVNRALCQFLGYENDELIGKTARDVIHPDDRPEDIKQATDLLSGARSIYSLEKRYIRKDGEIAWGLLTVKIVRDVLGEPAHFITQVFDITERRRLQAMKKDFVSVVSHELRTPVTSILAALDLLLSNTTGELPDSTHRLLSIARLNGERLNALVNDILTMQKLSSGELAINLESVDLTALVRHAAEINQPYADKHRVSFRCELPDRQIFCRTDPARFQQIAANLISNAAKFSEPGSGVELSVADAGDCVRFSVRDHGKGMTEQQQKLIFEPFVQVDTPSANDHVGTGLGLSITKQLVEFQGGSIAVQSAPGEGSEFSVEFARADPPAADHAI